MQLSDPTNYYTGTTPYVNTTSNGLNEVEFEATPSSTDLRTVFCLTSNGTLISALNGYPIVQQYNNPRALGGAYYSVFYAMTAAARATHASKIQSVTCSIGDSNALTCSSTVGTQFYGCYGGAGTSPGLNLINSTSITPGSGTCLPLNITALILDAPAVTANPTSTYTNATSSTIAYPSTTTYTNATSSSTGFSTNATYTNATSSVTTYTTTTASWPASNTATSVISQPTGTTPGEVELFLPCPAPSDDASLFAQYYNGTGFVQNLDNQDNTVAAFPPVYTSFAGMAGNPCGAISQCATTTNDSPNVHGSFDLHFVASNQSWVCVSFYGYVPDTASFNVANSDVVVSYGYYQLD